MLWEENNNLIKKKKQQQQHQNRKQIKFVQYSYLKIDNEIV